MKINGGFLVELGLKPCKTFGELLKLFNTSGDYTEQGIRHVVEGFINLKLPKNINTIHGDSPACLNLLKIYFDYETEHKKADIKLRNENLPFNIFGAENIEQGAVDQMITAMRLPIAVAGVLVPDSHQGYNLPIGGILATENQVIPNAVGVDISCSMKMSVFEEVSFPEKNNAFRMELKESLVKQTCFGVGLNEKKGLIHCGFESIVLENNLWNDIPMLKKYNIRKLAENQIGTSGSGNHFVFFGNLDFKDGTPARLALLSHSGSRGVGYKIAKLYHDLACKNFDNKGFQGWAWLDLDTDNGKEYWAAMNLCADFARISHDMIHYRINKFLGLEPSFTAFTNHNIAYRETHIINGKEMDLVVHRKGAVRAFKDEIGIIAGDMVHDSFIVKGKGNESSLCSCSHGAGRVMSRQSAKEKFTHKQMENILNEFGVELLGGGIDESPMAYKDVYGVIDSQKDLVEIIGTFSPKIVKMAEQ
ncbi:MAG: RtcB family protein [Paludibacteraceae bacterium]|nr:RtcB family protein [Paludibacteraceae bacterium]